VTIASAAAERQNARELVTKIASKIHAQITTTNKEKPGKLADSKSRA
jgi:hypothetical protein